MGIGRWLPPASSNKRSTYACSQKKRLDSKSSPVHLKPGRDTPGVGLPVNSGEDWSN
jgi:hypothetical protein